MATSFGLGVRVQGLRRYYALLLCKDGRARLVKALDGMQVLKEVEFPLQFNVTYDLALKVEGQHLQGWVDGVLLFDLQDNHQPLEGGAAAILLEEGTLSCNAVEIK